LNLNMNATDDVDRRFPDRVPTFGREIAMISEVSRDSYGRNRGRSFAAIESTVVFKFTFRSMSMSTFGEGNQ